AFDQSGLLHERGRARRERRSDHETNGAHVGNGIPVHPARKPVQAERCQRVVAGVMFGTGDKVSLGLVWLARRGRMGVATLTRDNLGRESQPKALSGDLSLGCFCFDDTGTKRWSMSSSSEERRARSRWAWS